MGTNKYEISVVIPTYNRCSLLNYTLFSIANQLTEKDLFEVIVADDGSTDETFSLIKRYEAQLNIKYVFQEDKGFRPGSARNKGIAVASGKIIVFLDAGIILGNNCLNEHLNFHRDKGPDVSAIGYVYGFDNDHKSELLLKKMISPFEPDESIKQLLKFGYFDIRELRYRQYHDTLENLPAPWFYFWTCHVSVTRANLLMINGFDENFDGKWGVEDTDLGYRLHKSGTRIFLLRAAESIHFPHGKIKKDRQEEGYLNCLYFYKKFPSVYTKRFLDGFKQTEELPDINSGGIDLPVNNHCELP